MKSSKFHFILIILSTTYLCSAQVINKETINNKETIKSDGVEMNVTGSAAEMYDGTKSEKANEFFNKASEFGKVKDYKNAEKFYLKAIKEDPDFVEAFDNVVRIYLATGNYDKAITYYKKSIEIYPLGIMAHQNLGVVYNFTKEYKKAEDAYQLLIDIHPKSAEGYFGKANALMMQQEFSDALVNAKKALEIYEKEDSYHLADGYYLAGVNALYAGQLEEARKYIELARAKGSKIPPALDEALQKEAKEKKPKEESNEEEEMEFKFETEEDFRKQEPIFVKVATWLEVTPIDENPKERFEFSTYALKWASEVPYISLVLDEKTIAFSKECEDCLMVFISNWAKHAIETKDYKNHKAGALAGAESLIRFYIKNKSSLGKSSEIEKMIKLQKKGKLKDLFKHL